MTADPATAFRTTVVGSMPKPAWLSERIPLNTPGKELHGRGADWLVAPEALGEAQDDATRLAIAIQDRAGIDVLSDGEQRRTSYLTHVTRALGGIDFSRIAHKWTQKGRRRAEVGRCTGPIRHLAPILADDLRFARRCTARPVKITLPGPVTAVEATADEAYGDPRAMALDFAAALNAEARALEALGPALIQFDEPVLARLPDVAEDWGFEAIARAVRGLAVPVGIHVCYSYPMPGVERPINDSYPTILAGLERLPVSHVSLEFEAAGLPPALLRHCPSKTVLFGCVSNGTDTVEPPEAIARRLREAAEWIAPERLMAAPDCGLVPLTPPVAERKLRSLAQAAGMARRSITETAII
ncbi:MAG: 5-methyltetrahydropteroyltriglutamate--homocysteine methyltransferase [Pseudomonadota bacterium]